MTTLITGATGHLGALTVEHVLARIPASELAVSVRDPKKAVALAGRGVDVRHGDFDDPETLRTAFAGVDRLLLVSADGPDEVRLEQHGAAVRAAVEAGVGFIAYTSVTDADSSQLGVAAVHKATEGWIRDSGVPFAFLRNALYHENYTLQLPQAYQQGAVVTSTGTGRVASASRDDLALAAAVVLTTEGHQNAVYELNGPRAWSFDELASIAAEVTGKPLAHRSIPYADLVAVLLGAGLPGFVAEMVADIYANIRGGVLAQVRPDLEKLIGRPPTPIEDAVRVALGSA